MATELQIIQALLARPSDDRDVSPEFREAATRWEKELSSGKYTCLTDKQREWLFRVEDICDAHDIGVPTRGYGSLYGDGGDDEESESFFFPDIGDK